MRSLDEVWDNNSRVFFVRSGVTATIEGLTISQGKALGDGVSGYGGGILKRSLLDRPEQHPKRKLRRHCWRRHRLP